jgi:hypothetical protein
VVGRSLLGPCAAPGKKADEPVSHVFLIDALYASAPFSRINGVIL